jgi:ABC-type nitrate/sulfonate/bicarbonate transport system substrate-binding protein
MNRTITRRRFGKLTLAAGVAAGTGAMGFSAKSAHAEATLTFQAAWLTDPEFMGFLIAIDNGYYAEEGLKVNYLPGGPNLIPEGSLLSGKADIGLTAAVSVGRSISQRNAPLKIVGVQYQKYPNGFMSFANKNINGPKDLEGKTIAVSTPGMASFQAFVKLHNLNLASIRVVPYAFNPAPLISGEVDVIQDFVTQLPFLIEKASGKPVHYFMHQDYGMPLYSNLVTVPVKMLEERRADIVKFLRASRKGWIENFKDTTKYTAIYNDTRFKGSGSTLEAENYFNKFQESLMANPKGYFWLADEDMVRNLKTLKLLGVNASPDMFDPTIVKEL